MATGTIEELLGQKPLGSTIGANDLVSLIAGEGTDGKRRTFKFDADGALVVSGDSGGGGSGGDASAANQVTGNTSLASIDSKIPASPSTAGNQATIINGLASIDGHVDGLEGLAGTTNSALASILAKILAAPATEAKQDTGNTSLGTIAGKDFATQTTLAAILVKLADPATQATLAAVLAKISGDPATQTTLAAILTKLADPSTSAKQDTGNTSLAAIAAKDFATQTTLAAILVKLADLATQTTAAAILAKLTSDPATQATLAAVLTAVQGATPAGTNLIGKVGIDQTTPGTTDRATVGKTKYIDVTLSLPTSANSAGVLLADTQAISNMVRVNDFGAVLVSLSVIDSDDQGAAFTVYLLDANNSFGTEGSTPTITDSNAGAILGKVEVGTADYNDLGGVRMAGISGLSIAMQPASGSTTGYLAVVNGAGTPTYTAAGVKLRLGILQD